MPDHNACFIEWELVNGVVEITLVPSVPKDLAHSHETRNKIPGGGHRKNKPETTEQTGRRELKEETGRSVKLRVKPVSIHRIDVKGHVKEAFLVPRSGCRGQLRTEVLDDGDAMLLPPIRVSLDRGIEIVYRNPKNRFHLDSLLKAKEFFLARGYRTGP